MDFTVTGHYKDTVNIVSWIKYLADRQNIILSTTYRRLGHGVGIGN